MKDGKHVFSFCKVSLELRSHIWLFFFLDGAPSVLFCEVSAETGATRRRLLSLLCAFQECLGTHSFGAICHMQL